MKTDKYLSIITNFGCHYTCPYCIVKNNNMDIPRTTIKGLKLLKAAGFNDINVLDAKREDYALIIAKKN